MSSTLFVLVLASSVATVIADCNRSDAPPDTGDIALYHDSNCRGDYLNIGAMNSCQNWPDFDACSAITRRGVTCDIYDSDGCDGDDYIATIDSAGYRNFCDWPWDETIQSVRCRSA